MVARKYLMDPKLFREKLQTYAEVEVKSDAVPADNDPLIIVRLHDCPCECQDCGLELARPPRRNHYLKNAGWRTFCTGCGLSRQPGQEEFGYIQTRRDRQRDSNVSHLGPREELLIEPMPQPQIDHQSIPTEPAPIVVTVDSVIVREYPESLIREFVSHQVEIQPQSNDAPVLGTEVRKD